MSAEEPQEPRLHAVAVGPRKTATTWLDACLREHPDLCLPARVKETFFLDRRWDRGWGWYWEQFDCPDRTPRPRRMEVAAGYFATPEAPERLHGRYPECRVVVTLRDPAERTRSLYLHHRKKGRLTEGFAGALEERPELFRASRYADWLPRWRERFGAERVEVVLTEEIAADPEAVLRRLWRFLDVRQVPPPEAAGERVYGGTQPRFPRLARAATKAGYWLHDRGLHGVVDFFKRLGVMKIYRGGEAPDEREYRELRPRLVEAYADDIAYVEELLGRELPAWRRR